MGRKTSIWRQRFYAWTQQCNIWRKLSPFFHHIVTILTQFFVVITFRWWIAEKTMKNYVFIFVTCIVIYIVFEKKLIMSLQKLIGKSVQWKSFCWQTIMLIPYPWILDKKSRPFSRVNPNNFQKYFLFLYCCFKRTRMCFVFLSENDASSVPKIRFFKKSSNLYTINRVEFFVQKWRSLTFPKTSGFFVRKWR